MTRDPDGRIREATGVRPAPSPAAVFAGLMLLQAGLVGAWAVWPPGSDNRTFDLVLIAVMIAIAACGLLGLRERTAGWGLEAMAALTWMVSTVVVATRLLEASKVLWGGVLILAAVAVAFYLPADRARIHVTAMLAGYALVALALAPRVRPLFVLAALVCAGASAAAIAAMRRDRDRALGLLADLATTDPLTGLLNRRGLEAEAPVVQANAERAGLVTVVAVIDLDDFKQVNDALGHEAGDQLLQEITEHWRRSARTGDLIARTGGDEFVVVMPHASQATAGMLLCRIRDEAVTRWSHGWTVWRPDEPLNEAIERADAAMYDDKAGRAGRRAGDQFSDAARRQRHWLWRH